MIRIRLGVLWTFFALPLLVRADGTTDININPATGVTISASGSYRLVADAAMTAAVVAVEINSNDVDLDLGGHTITCFGSPAAVIRSNAGVRVRVRNGDVLGTGADSIITLAGNDCVVEDIMVNGGSAAAERAGIAVTGAGGRVSRAKVRNLISTGASALGIFAVGNGALVDDCQVDTIRGSSVAGSFSVGIQVGTGGIVRGCSVGTVGDTAGITAQGIVGTTGSLIEGSTVNTIGTGASGVSDGIIASGTGLTIVRNCTVVTVGASGTGADGISLSGPGVRALGNSIGGIQVGTSGAAIGINATGGNPVITDNTVANLITNGGTAGAKGIVATGIGAKLSGNTINAVATTGSGTVRGIETGAGASIEINTVRNSASVSGVLSGILSGTDAVVRGNTVTNNDCSGTTATGILVGDGSLVVDNTCSDGNGAGAVGILTGSGGTIRGNVVRNYDSSAANAYGIQVFSRVNIEGNTITDCNEPASVFAVVMGITVWNSCRIVNNVCANNLAITTGSSYGIFASTACLIEGNLCENNDAAGVTESAGIRIASTGTGNRVIGNNCVGQSGGTGSNGNTGIFIGGTDNFIARNTTSGNFTRGITISVVGNRTQENMSSDGAISGGSGLAGDLADTAY